MEYTNTLEGLKEWTREAEDAFRAGNPAEAQAAALIAQCYAQLRIARAASR